MEPGIDLSGHLLSGDLIVSGQGLGEPTPLLQSVFEVAAGLTGVRFLGGLSMSDVLSHVPPTLELTSFLGMGPNAGLIASGRMQLLPCHLSEVPRLFRRPQWRPDVVV